MLSHEDQVTLAYALSLAHTRYKWGGSSPLSGLDCSGFVVEILKSLGVVPNNYDATAQGLYHLCQRGGIEALPSFGAIAFFGKNDEAITHVGFCVDSYRMLEAGSGDRMTNNLDDAIARDARIKLRPIRHRSDFIATLRPPVKI